MIVSQIQSPLGPLTITVSDKGLKKVEFSQKGQPKTRQSHNHPVMTKTVGQLQEYFLKQRRVFDLELDLEGTPFQTSVWLELTRIPYGKTISYAQLAVNIGHLKAFRAVGNANGCNSIPIIIPCHRVIASNGSLGGYSAGLAIKRWLLEFEQSVSQNEA